MAVINSHTQVLLTGISTYQSVLAEVIRWQNSSEEADVALSRISEQPDRKRQNREWRRQL